MEQNNLAATRAPIKQSTKTDLYLSGGKRAFDFIFALALLPLLVPVIAVLWLLTRRDGGPGFFGHSRINQNGGTFKCWKIRSMCVDAEERLSQHLKDNPEAAAEWARDYKLNDDPRITRIGSFIRKTSLDELPQIWNVIKGEMSFVGPRPIVANEVAKYGASQWAYFASKPGITGAWQVSGRNDVSYEERVQMDVQYINNVSFTHDIITILKTATAVLKTTGK